MNEAPPLGERRRRSQFVEMAFVEVEPIEASHLVRAGIGAVPRADAAIVHLEVQPFRRMHCGIHGADFFTRGLFAVNARQRLTDKSRFLNVVAHEIAVDANPVQFAVAFNFVLADDGDVVFGLARDHARTSLRASPTSYVRG